MLITMREVLSVLILLVSVLGLNLDICFGHGGNSGSCPSVVVESPAHHQCDHGHGDGDGHLPHHHHHYSKESLKGSKLPEELAEEEDLKLYGFDTHHVHAHDAHDDDHEHEHDLEHATSASELSGVGLWIHAMGCSLLVSMASLICLIILPVIFLQGKPSKAAVDSLAAFGAGAMLGDAFLHQLPHAFGGGHSHSHDHHMDHNSDHVHHHGAVHTHSHSLKDLSVGLSILSGILLFLLVEKIVRYVEEFSGKGAKAQSHSHHHHHHKHSKKLKDDQDAKENLPLQSTNEQNGNPLEMSSKENMLDGASNGCLNEEKYSQPEGNLRKRVTDVGKIDDNKPELDAASGFAKDMTQSEKDSTAPSNLVFGYLNLFSDGVHNFTDGMALGSAFLLHGSVGGWSRTLFLLAHEIPQEVGDFGILVRSGFSVSKALFFNFLSALVALAGTALALLLGKDPGQSSLIEGFTAGGFIYIAVAGVLPEMNSNNSTFRSTLIQFISLILGMAVALCISLVE